MYIYIYIYLKIGPKCGKWDCGGLKMWEVGLWVSKNVGSGTLGSKKCGKWDYQDAVSPPHCRIPLNIVLMSYVY